MDNQLRPTTLSYCSSFNPGSCPANSLTQTLENMLLNYPQWLLNIVWIKFFSSSSGVAGGRALCQGHIAVLRVPGGQLHSFTADCNQIVMNPEHQALASCLLCSQDQKKKLVTKSVMKLIFPDSVSQF